MGIDALFEFIFGNLAFIIIVIGGIISFLKRANQSTEQPTKPKKEFHPNLDWPTIEFELPKVESEQQTNRKQELTTNFEITEPIEVDVQTNPYYEQLRKMDERKKEQKEPTSLNRPKIQEKKIKAHSVNLEINAHSVTKKKVIDGLIWGEILGPPRARKKHTYSYMKRS
ncbi:hypothetical protein [Calidifontibacillus oryziterrae]|uniref:hypothetical protein n=1 Tax=Calidifontibacillus oryziterrae TaxID=1191699 RepID=UPI0002EA7A61|nr:hypothetical protein [Calidifontibacillus oryziterrae]